MPSGNLYNYYTESSSVLQAHRFTHHTPKADDDIFRPVGLDFKKVPLIHNAQDEFFHIIGFIGVFRLE